MCSVTPLFIGLGTAVNVATVVVGSLIGLAVGNRLPERTRTTVTDVLGLTTLVIGGMNVAAMSSTAVTSSIGVGVALMVVLGSLLAGSIIGSTLRLEDRFEILAGWLRDRLGGTKEGGSRQRFVNGFVTATLVFCIGPLTILGSLQDGLGKCADQLIVKAILDGFASVAFASSLGIGVMASAIAVAVVQGSLTVLGFAAGDVLPALHIDVLTVTGGIILMGLSLRLLNLKQVRVADMLPALLIAPLVTQLILAVR